MMFLNFRLVEMYHPKCNGRNAVSLVSGGIAGEGSIPIKNKPEQKSRYILEFNTSVTLKAYCNNELTLKVKQSLIGVLSIQIMIVDNRSFTHFEIHSSTFSSICVLPSCFLLHDISRINMVIT